MCIRDRYFTGDENVVDIKNKLNDELKTVGYTTHPYIVESGLTYLVSSDNKKIPIQIFGEHNLQNLNGAFEICLELGLDKSQFYSAIQSFKGASKRLELVKETPSSVIYKDFAHSPSKLKATTKALANQFPTRELVACMELHTFSSLSDSFLAQYNGAMDSANKAYVYFNPLTLEHKKLAPISIEEVANAFGGANVEVLTDAKALVNKLSAVDWKNKNLLLMSSGNFDGIDFNELANDLI